MRSRSATLNENGNRIGWIALVAYAALVCLLLITTRG
jgi:hypothetical protein